MAMAQHFNARCRHQCKEGLVSPDEFEIVETRLHRGSIWHAIEEIEGANRRAHLIWRKQLRGNRGGETAGNSISPCLGSCGQTKQNT